MKHAWIVFAFVLTVSSAQTKFYTIVIHGGAGTIRAIHARFRKAGVF